MQFGPRLQSGSGTRGPALRSAGSPSAAGAASRALPFALLGIATVLAHASSFSVALVGDDYRWIEKARTSAWTALLAPRGLFKSFYRPWSRELHFAVLDRTFGLSPAPYHAVNLTLTFAALALGFVWMRRIAGAAIAAVAVAAIATLTPWQLLNDWASGSQDLWMIAWSLAALLAAQVGRGGWAAVAFALALLSKETAAAVPLIALAEGAIVRRRNARGLAADLAPMLVVLLAWAAVHPLLGGALWYARPGVGPRAPGPSPPFAWLWRSTLGSLDLDERPQPDAGWGGALLAAIPVALALGAFVWTAGFRRDAGLRGRTDAHAPGPGAVPRARIAAFGVACALAGWLPLAFPALGWHAYYALFGAMGAWLALATVIERSRPAVLASVLLLATLSAARADTPSEDWSTGWFQRRAATFLEVTHADLMRLHPRLPLRSRLFFTAVPAGSGLIPGGEESPPLRVWYSDSTLQAAYLSHYAPRPAEDTVGRDYFFRFDSRRGWIEIAAGEERDAAAHGDDPAWRRDHEQLAGCFAQAGDWPRAEREYGKLAVATPEDATYAFDAGLCACEGGQGEAARRWFERAASLPGADSTMMAAARTGCP